jgi:hypothetical protein
MALHRSLSALTVAALGLAMFGCSHDQQARLDPSFGLFFNQSGQSLTLAYGRANSDDVGLVLQCQSGSRQVDVSDLARRSSADRLTLTSNNATDALPARVDTSGGPPTLWAKTAISSGAMQGFRTTGRIGVSSAGARYTVSADSAERQGVERFFRACEKA